MRYVHLCLHQLVEVNERPKMKISEDPKKTTVPGRKDIYRLADSEGERQAPRSRSVSVAQQCVALLAARAARLDGSLVDK